MNSLKSLLPNFFKGMAMGMAEVVPGVSGGTIAFITGIYERILRVISNIRPGLIELWKTEGFKAVLVKLDIRFLILLISGMVSGIVLGVFGVSYLLENFPPVIWSFFFGLIVASSIYMLTQIEEWSWGKLTLLVLGILVAYGITILSPATGNPALWFVFLSGAIAITALILPGISGSFILLLMGMYELILGNVKNALSSFDSDSILVVIVFALGCLTGLFSFANLMRWTFNKYKAYTIAVLTGFMIGSLNKIWPWRNVLTYRVSSNGDSKPMKEVNVLPNGYESEPLVVFSILSFILALALVYFLVKNDKSGQAEPSTSEIQKQTA